MSCNCHFAILPDKTPGTLTRLFEKVCNHHPGDAEVLAIGWTLSNLLGYATVGNEFSTPDGRLLDCLDIFGITAVPPGSVKALRAVARSLPENDFSFPEDFASWFGDYDPDDDDGDGTLSEQVTRFIAMCGEAILKNHWLICFGI